MDLNNEIVVIYINHPVSLREKGVDLNEKLLPRQGAINVSLREKGVDLNKPIVTDCKQRYSLPS